MDINLFVAIGVTAIGGAFGLWKWIEAKIDKKADKHAVNNQVQEAKNELHLHRQASREDIRQLYKNAEDDRKLVRDGFDQLSREIHETHISLLDRMDRK